MKQLVTLSALRTLARRRKTFKRIATAQAQKSTGLHAPAPIMPLERPAHSKHDGNERERKAADDERDD